MRKKRSYELKVNKKLKNSQFCFIYQLFDLLNKKSLNSPFSYHLVGKRSRLGNVLL